MPSFTEEPLPPPWPPVTSESVDWVPSLPDELLTRAQAKRYVGPYRAAAVPTIAGRTPPMSPAAAALVADAAAAVSRFDSDLGREIAPFASILLRSESASSSQIENLSSGAKQIALAELGSRDKRNATLIVSNVAAMRAAVDLADSLTGDSVLAMHRALMIDDAPDIAGQWRSDQVWIGGSSIGPHGADYIAPRADRVPMLMDDLISFIRAVPGHPLAVAAVAHAQFETIHPFPDGNGRTGRALLHSLLRRTRLTNNVTVPVSAGLLTDTARYFSALDSYREGDVTPMIETIAHASFAAVDNGGHLVADLRAVRARWDDAVTARRGSAARRLLDVVLRRPVVDRAAVADELGISSDNVGRAVDPLVEAGILREFTGLARNRMWHAADVTDALDEFARRAIRRTPR